MKLKLNVFQLDPAALLFLDIQSKTSMFIQLIYMFILLVNYMLILLVNYMLILLATRTDPYGCSNGEEPPT